MSFKNICMALAVMALALTSITAQAAPVTVQNYSFEEPVLGDGNYGKVNWLGVPGWTDASWDGGIQDWTNSQYPGTSGNGNLAWPGHGLQSGYLGNGGAILYQNVGPILPDTIYTLTVAVGRRLDFGNNEEYWSIALVSGAYNGTVLGYIDQTSGYPAPGTFVDKTVVVTTGASVSGNLFVVLSGYGGQQTSVDNVRLDATIIPEPGTVVLLITGLAGLLCYAWRKCK